MFLYTFCSRIKNGKIKKSNQTGGVTYRAFDTLCKVNVMIPPDQLASIQTNAEPRQIKTVCGINANNEASPVAILATMHVELIAISS